MRIILVGCLLSFSLLLQGQDPQRFEKEVNDLVAGDSAINNKKLILFTGSSSIRFWKSLHTDFPKQNTLNHGFGGSEMSDLFYYAETLILSYQPKKIFIYEGDNDLNSGKSADEILQTAKELLALIRAKLPKGTKVIFIAAKPKLARWTLKDKYMTFNEQLNQWTQTQKRVEFADVWTALVDSNGNVLPDIFIEDGLHLNEKGYVLWADAIRKFM
ncbi:MAG: GDSL-type esterase/lipase family protein [Cytophagales bacterium]|nr:GDSL-type esterase/lipase family protein [Cytophagales bacterium]